MIQVNSTADASLDHGNCTLREAIQSANTNTASGATVDECPAGGAAADTIRFDIGGGGSVETISPTHALPDVTEAVYIDGFTQGCPSGGPCIEIDGSSAGVVANGIEIESGGAGSTIRGFVINAFENFGVSVNSSSNNRIEGNYIGTDVTGFVAVGNQSGVALVGSSTDNHVVANVISGNGFDGVTPPSLCRALFRSHVAHIVQSRNREPPGDYLSTQATFCTMH